MIHNRFLCSSKKCFCSADNHVQCIPGKLDPRLASVSPGQLVASISSTWGRGLRFFPAILRYPDGQKSLLSTNNETFPSLELSLVRFQGV